MCIWYLFQQILVLTNRYLIIFTMQVYGLLHRNLEAELLDKCSNESLMGEEAKRIAHLLCSAAGIFEYIKNGLLPSFGSRYNAFFFPFLLLIFAYYLKTSRADT